MPFNLAHHNRLKGNITWRKRATKHGFTDEHEMWHTIYKDFWRAALGELFECSGDSVYKRVCVVCPDVIKACSGRAYKINGRKGKGKGVPRPRNLSPQIEGGKVLTMRKRKKYCCICGRRLSGYNKSGRCFCHGAVGSLGREVSEFSGAGLR